MEVSGRRAQGSEHSRSASSVRACWFRVRLHNPPKWKRRADHKSNDVMCGKPRAHTKLRCTGLSIQDITAYSYGCSERLRFDRRGRGINVKQSKHRKQGGSRRRNESERDNNSNRRRMGSTPWEPRKGEEYKDLAGVQNQIQTIHRGT